MSGRPFYIEPGRSAFERMFGEMLKQQLMKRDRVIATHPEYALIVLETDSRTALMAKEYPDIRMDHYHIDILAAHFVLRPTRFDVVVASNLFGDILSDLGSACTGTIGIAPSANLNPEKNFPSMFEPVHGSAPDIFGRNIANPIGQIWSGAMMLDHLGHADAARTIVSAIEQVLNEGPRTPDLGGTASTQEVGRAIADAVCTLKN